MKNIIITLLLSLPVMAHAGGLFPEQPVPMSPGYGQNGTGAHAAVPEGIPNEACIVNPVSMQTGSREVTVTELVEGDSISIPTTLLFDFDGDGVRPKGREDLKNILLILKNGGAKELVVTGHTDSKGTEKYNDALGLRRAKAVSAVLRALGMENVTPATAGESEPVASNTFEDGTDNPEGRQENRRVVIEVTEVAQKEVETVVTETFTRNPQVFHVMSDSHRVSCTGNGAPSIFGNGNFIYNGYYPSYQIYGNGRFLR